MPAPLIGKYIRYFRHRDPNNFICDYSELSVFSSVKRVNLGKRVCLAAASRVTDSKIGRYTSVGYASKIVNADIGSFCAISWHSTINAVSHPIDHLTISAFPYVAKFRSFDAVDSARPDKLGVKIGHDVWIGANVVILPGIKVGDGAIVGAGSIVTKDVPSYAIVAGNPAKLIRYRFSEDTIMTLTRLAWWNWKEEKINENIHLFRKPLTKEICDILESLI